MTDLTPIPEILETHRRKLSPDPRDVDEDGTDYPASDDEPIGETEWHTTQLAHLLEMLQTEFAADLNVLVAGNNLIYDVRGDPKRYLVPDLSVVLGVPKLPRRRSWWSWREGKFFDFILELLLEKTRDRHYTWKARIDARVFGTPEYFLCDPDVESVEGYRLQGRRYFSIEPDEKKRIWSEKLELGFVCGQDSFLQIDRRDPTHLPSPPELAAQAQRAAELEAEVERLREEIRHLGGEV